MKHLFRRVMAATVESLPWNQFGDRPVALLGNPYFLARFGLRKEIERVSQETPEGPLLDVGCGSMPYRSLFLANQPYECLEIDQLRWREKPHVTHLYDGRKFNLAEHVYGVVLCTQTLEHSFWPEEMLGEIFRVLRPGGRLLLTAPLIWPEHEQPFDSQRFTSFGLVARLEKAGFEVRGVSKTNPGLATVVQLVIELVERPLRNFLLRIRQTALRVFVTQGFRLLLALPYFFLNLLGLAANATSRRKSAEMYLDLMIVAEKPLLQ